MDSQPLEPILIVDPARETAVSVDSLELLAQWMDSVFEIPGTRIRFGFDALIGLVPWLGDTVTSFVSLYILQAASRAGVPRVTLVRMAANIAIDYVLGTVPLAGDAFDVFWKANLKNVDLLKRHILVTPAEKRRARSGDWLFVAGLIAGLIALLVGCVTIAWWIASGVWQALMT
ncbi:MAG: DUF4112 domain-containing protein [Planctomycetia bacterium]|nr:DUF4112 domain-containing protein [Planctomycetia bacterium]